MDDWLIAMMLSGSIFLGVIALSAFLWAVKNGQFDDEERFLNAVKFDSIDDLNDAAAMEKRKEKLKKRL